MNAQVTIPSATSRFQRPTFKEAEEALRTLLRWAGDDPDREGLRDIHKPGVTMVSSALLENFVRTRQRDGSFSA